MSDVSADRTETGKAVAGADHGIADRAVFRAILSSPFGAAPPRTPGAVHGIHGAGARWAPL
jgi:hypothetical protein